MIGIISPGGVNFLVFLLVQAYGNHAISPCCQEGNQFLIEPTAEPVVLERLERRTTVKHFFSMEDYRVVGM